MSEIGGHNPLSTPKRGEGLSRMEFFTRLHQEAIIKKPTIEGLENLTDIPKDEPLVIATTHLTDIDMEAIMASLAPHRQLGATSMSAHQEIPIYGGFMRWAGGGQVFDVQGTHSEKGRPTTRFRPQDFDAMIPQLTKGRAIIIAAHPPTGPGEWQLPNNPGIGAVYLAEKAHAKVLPVALDIQGEPFDVIKEIPGSRLLHRKRPSSRLVVGKPIDLDPMSSEELSLVARMYTGETRHELSSHERENAHAAMEKLKQQGKTIMYSLATLLPEEKRGLWQATAPMTSGNG